MFEDVFYLSKMYEDEIYLDMVRELFGPFTRRTLMQYEFHVGPAITDAAEDMEADATEAGNGVLDEDYLVDQTPPQYR
ncbi:hypothetical protein F0562_018183 [Nyssa sinensis]|uniref:Uncharacterized protein n=1 Tax=Nyssa sinensis TaxID=561372 RepID=A0A5J4Z9E0_9ASTE|nr:hypothetical protein F0562_018183 [Nyssa sinensis]